MSQREFARFVGVTPEHVCRMEKGHKVPGPVMQNLLKRMVGEVRDGQERKRA